MRNTASIGVKPELLQRMSPCTDMYTTTDARITPRSNTDILADLYTCIHTPINAYLSDEHAWYGLFPAAAD